MIVRLIKKRQIINFNLPTTVSGNYWITDNDFLGNSRNLINVEEFNGEWKIKSDFETRIMQGDKEVESAILKDYSLYFLKVNTDNEYVILYCSPSQERELTRLQPKSYGEITIGNSETAAINYSYPLVSRQHAKLVFSEKGWSIQDLNSKYGTYVNNEAISSKALEYGDIIFIMGLKIIVMPNFLIVNRIGNFIRCNSRYFNPVGSTTQTFTESENEDEELIEFFKEDDFFYRQPRFKTMIEDADINIDPPPGREGEDKTPAIYTIGPMLTMGMTSAMMAFTSLQAVLNGEKDLSYAMPSLVIAGAMLASMLLWPLLTRRYENKQRKKRELLRQQKYREYIEKKRQDINSEMNIQRQILIDNYLPLKDTEDIIINKKRALWEREIDQDDFLSIRLGIGTTELQGNVNFPTEHFSLEDDDLLQEVYKLGAESRTLENVPIAVSFIKSKVSAIIGTAQNKQQVIEGMMLQTLGYHSYADLKVVILTNKTKKNNWDYMKIAPHNWSDNKQMRFYAENLDEAKEISLYLEKELQGRKFNDVDGNMKISDKDYKNYQPYYLIITDDYKSYRDLDILKDVCETELNYGFSLVVISPRLVNLPNECQTFISIGDKKSGVFENELVSNKQKEFVADIDPNLNMHSICKILANIPIDLEKENRTLPNGLTFLEMYNVGMVEQLNILNRWRSNDPTKSLQASVGVDKSHELFKLDLHEKFHGPHGLIAGMTGSGKSEFIITYILSMAINYHPYEVSFVLIDYKGGGLAGVFENKETGLKLPHLAGTITNLDTIEMSRSLASIQSELRKRQRMFNEARDKLNESTIDIYKYQSLYRKGLVEHPISHLFIISDEFAELKDQQPEFMDQFISTARIGRSLGVHLILATQKPAGVVNDQIWSNSKFRVCLKVQDKSDSMDMIKLPDAAELKNPGRFYLQVGYNELFALGQAAWAGAQYYPQEKRKKRVDKSIDIIDNVGNSIKSLDLEHPLEKIESKGEEVTNIVKYIVDEAKEEKVTIDKLWLDRIPDVIYTEELKEKYGYVPVKNVIEPIIGEFDDPDNQSQGLLTLPLSERGNTIIYGAQGTGKELMLTNLVYSSITGHNSNEVNFYILDFGAETLTTFRNAPHVGEVLLSTEEEKIANLFKMIVQISEERKKIFIDYNGSYDFYINHGGKQIPLITVVINNVEAFIESYPDYEDVLGQLTRDCLKAGIVFIFTTSGTNTVRYRLRQNFAQNIVLQFNDDSDYGTILSGVRKKQPSKVYGRGLVALGEGVYEFQTAYAYTNEKMTDYLKIICEKLDDMLEYKARKIPILPEVVTSDFVKDRLGNLATIPVGVTRETLEIATINLLSSYMYTITGEDISTETAFYTGLINNISKCDNTRVVIMDSLSIITRPEENENIIYDGASCDNALQKMKDIFNNKVDNNDSVNTICIITGLKQLLGKISPEDKTKFIKLLTDAIKLQTIKFVIVDSIDNIKQLLFEQAIKQNLDLSQGIWLGNGISNQFTLKVTTSSRILREEINEGFGYIIVKGKAYLMKLMSDE